MQVRGGNSIKTEVHIRDEKLKICYCILLLIENSNKSKQFQSELTSDHHIYTWTFLLCGTLPLKILVYVVRRELALALVILSSYPRERWHFAWQFIEDLQSAYPMNEPYNLKKKIVCFKILVSKSWIFWDWNITKIPRVFNNFLLNRWIAILNRKKKSWPEVPILFQNLRSELAYTFNWTKSTARLWRFVNELWKEKKKSPYLPTHRWNGGSRAGNEHIFKGGLILNDTLMSGISHVEIPAINVVFLNNLGL